MTAPLQTHWIASCLWFDSHESIHLKRIKKDSLGNQTSLLNTEARVNSAGKKAAMKGERERTQRRKENRGRCVWLDLLGGSVCLFSL